MLTVCLSFIEFFTAKCLVLVKRIYEIKKIRYSDQNANRHDTYVVFKDIFHHHSKKISKKRKDYL